MFVTPSGFHEEEEGEALAAKADYLALVPDFDAALFEDPDFVRSKVQARLSKPLSQRAYREVLDDPARSDRDRAVLQSLTHPEASDWLALPVPHLHQTMASESFGCRLQYQLLIPIFQHGSHARVFCGSSMSGNTVLFTGPRRGHVASIDWHYSVTASTVHVAPARRAWEKGLLHRHRWLVTTHRRQRVALRAGWGRHAQCPIARQADPLCICCPYGCSLPICCTADMSCWHVDNCPWPSKHFHLKHLGGCMGMRWPCCRGSRGL
jgi:hypothetical protein